MGYRNYIGYLSTEEYNKLKGMTVKQVLEYKKKDVEDKHLGVYKFGKELYEFGKYCDFNPPKEAMLPFFSKKATNKKWGEGKDFCVIRKAFLAYLISTYKEKVQGFYKEMLGPFNDKETNEYCDFLNSVKRTYKDGFNYTFDFTKITDKQQTALFAIFEHIRSMGREWNNTYDVLPYNLENGTDVTTSWKYEYAIFELVKIYKSFDWDNNVMIYYGY